VNSLTTLETLDIETISLDVFPNPAGNYLYYTLSGVNRFKGKIELFTVDGQLVRSASANEITGKLELTGLANGTYLLRATDDSVLLFSKVVVTK